MNKKYFYIAMSQQDLLKNQVIEEIVRERNNYFINRENPSNFWIIMSPFFLETNEILNKVKKTNFFKIKQKEILYQNKFYTGVILSTNVEYINWLKLRLGYFENFNNPEFNSEFRSDGLYGEIEIQEISNNLLFDTKKINIHPKILLEIYSEAFETFLKSN